MNDVVCDDGDPCTIDTCVEGVCDNAPLPDLESILCTCALPAPPMCADQTIPRRVERLSARACRLFSKAVDARARRQRRRLLQGAHVLRRAVAVVVRAQVRGLSPECASALADRFETTGQRATQLAGPR